VQPAEDPPHGGLGVDQRLQLPLDLTGRQDAVEHHPMCAEDAGERGVELFLDANGGLLELAARLLERREDTAPLAVDLIVHDRRGIGNRFEQVHHEPGRAHPDARGDRGAREGRRVAAGLNDGRVLWDHVTNRRARRESTDTEPTQSRGMCKGSPQADHLAAST
jgi:hypothetical protein